MIGTKIDPSCIGHDIEDASGILHQGIGNVVMPILAISEEDMRDFYSKCKEKATGEDLEIFDFVLCAQNSKSYEEYEGKLKGKKLEEQDILGLAIYGDQKAATSLCGNLGRWK